MKYRVAGVLAMVLMLSAILLATVLDEDNPNRRIHQHEVARQPDAGCDCDGSGLCTHLPLVIIDTDGADIPGKPIADSYDQETSFTMTSEGESMLRARITVIDSDTHNNHPSDTPDLESEMLIRVRGNSSRYFDKYNYLVRLVDEDGEYQEQEIMGMDAHYEWAMHGPYLDKSLIRNYMWYNIAGEIMDYAPNVRFCEVIINGEYKGLYVMTETITNGVESRLNISEPIDGSTKTGYLLRLDRGGSSPIKNIETFTSYAYRNLQQLDIKYPRAGSLTQEMADAIAQEFSDFEKSLYSYDYDTENYGYHHSIDVQSFVDYFIINEFTANYDAGWLSTYIYKDIGGKYKMVIWDFNSACNNYTHPVNLPNHFEMQQNIWYFMLTKDEEFTDRIIRRYRELRKTYLSEQYLDDYIDNVLAYLGPAIERNFEVWGYTFDKEMIDPPERNPQNFEEAIAQLKDYIHERGEWMDKYIVILSQYSHESKNKKFNH